MLKEKIINALEETVVEITHQVMELENNFYWSNAKEIDIFFEMVSCILGSSVSFELSLSAAHYLKAQHLLDQLINDPFDQTLEQELAQALNEPLFISKGNLNKQRYRYPKLRANHIYRTAKSIYGQNYSLKTILNTSSSCSEARNTIVSICTGIGPKQASLFLRNIGFTQRLAILDSHVLDYMVMTNLVDDRPSITSLKSYKAIEEKLFDYATTLNFQLATLDTAIWIVMRSCKEDLKKCL